MDKKLNSFYKLVEAETPINMAVEPQESFESVNKALKDAYEVALKHPLPGKATCVRDGSKHRKTYVLVIVDNKEQKLRSK